ncbi:WGR domain-containing protein [Lamprocystis purpurea]|jgi:hypothetical protein|uniref:WGR domain-containing protein n=1 Tax=Lamprocystis purpurea TaxID=61598 RepID=UPI000371103C|nr:WGR domain-containing protein [Lamprocystis purpurea]
MRQRLRHLDFFVVPDQHQGQHDARPATERPPVPAAPDRKQGRTASGWRDGLTYETLARFGGHSMRWLHIAKARYYQAHLEKDLFGDWTLITVWGGLGSRLGRMRTTGVASYADGQAQIQKIAKRRQQHGYEAGPETPDYPIRTTAGER